jgi:hypothetical protein
MGHTMGIEKGFDIYDFLLSLISFSDVFILILGYSVVSVEGRVATFIVESRCDN